VVGGSYAWFAQAPTGEAAQDAASVARDPDPSTGATAKPIRAQWTAGAPRRVVIPHLHVDAPVIPIKAPGRTLVPPSDPQRLGWWADGARPGADEGSALVTGHTVHNGGGALDDLEQLERGDRVLVRTDRGRIPYTVRRVDVYSKGSIAAHAERLFSQDVPGRLVLVTCEDWDGERYLSNVVVIASPR
jgi:LPXTG-site transpeptidase (sortase) family protein